MRRRPIITILGILAAIALMSPLHGSASANRQEPEAATWRTMMNQTFESTFPPTGGTGNASWALRDYNGPSVGTKPNVNATFVWDDNSTRGHGGSFWSAHPNDWTSYGNNIDTWMRYGPFNLADARDARVLFAFWLDTEANFDFFTWGYTCSGLSNWNETSVSGRRAEWTEATMSLRPCVGRSGIYLRFNFQSDYSNPSSPVPTGVWVDDIRLQKLVP